MRATIQLSVVRISPIDPTDITMVSMNVLNVSEMPLQMPVRSLAGFDPDECHFIVRCTEVEFTDFGD